MDSSETGGSEAGRSDMDSSEKFHIGLVVNPIAGLGGPSGLKGSDAPDTACRAAELGVTSAIPAKLSDVLQGLSCIKDKLRFSTVSGAMGQAYLDAASVASDCIMDTPERTTSEDTKQAVLALVGSKPDLLLFAGGDGTARDVCSVVSVSQLSLGIPSGVKMHSGVFAVTPQAVVSVVKSLVSRKLVAACEAEVRDIDERSFQEGRVITSHYGELLVPDDQLLVQCVKCSGLPDDDIALNEIAAFVSDTIEDDTLYLFGSGGSLLTIKQAVGVDNPTLLGVDAWLNGKTLASDLNEPSLYDLVQRYPKVCLFLSVIGGQGIVFGRGNQQLSPRVLRCIGLGNVQFVGTQTRLVGLEGRALRVDSGDDQLNQVLSGYRKILCGYDDYVVYEIMRVGA